jgi:hypothetical protein
VFFKPFDGAPFSRGISPFKNNRNTMLVSGNPLLEVDHFTLQLSQFFKLTVVGHGITDVYTTTLGDFDQILSGFDL